MESEDVSAEVEWEARRVAAAFGVEEWESTAAFDDASWVEFDGCSASTAIWCAILDDGTIEQISVGERPHSCLVEMEEGRLEGITSEVEYRELMARGLFRMGVDDPYILRTLNCPLSAHEKLELRVSLPREFWPKKWLDEDTCR